MEPKYRNYEWSIFHKQFSLTQQATSGQMRQVLTARVDGCLMGPHASKSPDDGDVLSIIEVNPYMGLSPSADAMAIRIQESAEMAASISSQRRWGMLSNFEDTLPVRASLLYNNLYIRGFKSSFIQSFSRRNRVTLIRNFQLKIISQSRLLPSPKTILKLSLQLPHSTTTT